jgi:hypothetical protein
MRFALALLAAIAPLGQAGCPPAHFTCWWHLGHDLDVNDNKLAGEGGDKALRRQIVDDVVRELHRVATSADELAWLWGLAAEHLETQGIPEAFIHYFKTYHVDMCAVPLCLCVAAADAASFADFYYFFLMLVANAIGFVVVPPLQAFRMVLSGVPRWVSRHRCGMRSVQ